MMTQSHILIGLAILGRPKRAVRNALIIAGGVIPDAAIFILYAVEKFRGTSESVIWRDVYYSDFWQDVVAWGNSIPLWICLLAVGTVLRSRLKMNALGSAVTVFAIVCLVHMACDFPVHVDDAHRHLFPISSWRFRSAVSYWDPRYYGIQFAIFESVLGIALAGWMCMRFKNLLARIAIGLMASSYLAVPGWFAWQFLTA